MDAVQIFNDDVPDEFLKFLVAGFKECYKRADRAVAELCVDKKVQSNLFPYLRREIIEDFVLSCQGKFKGVTITNAGGNHFWYHVEIRAGRVVLTISAGVSDETPLRPAEYKIRLAKETQKLLFSDSDDVPNDSGTLYAVLIHNKEPGVNSQLGFAIVRFPKADDVLNNLTSFYRGEIDLLAGFEELGADDTVAAEVIVKETPAPVLKRG